MDLSDPRLSPLFVADPGGLPPAIIHTAEFDPMRDEGEVHAHRLAAAGVTVRLTRHPGMIHSFYGLNALLPQAETAIAAIAAELAIFLG